MSTPQPGQAKPNATRKGPTAVRFEAVGVTDIGRQRKHNEDHVLLRPELDLFVVADGMGGHNAGDVASKLATASLRNFYEATVDGGVPDGALSEGYTDLSPDARRLAAAIRKANRDVFEISSTYRQHHGMGSTVVAAYLGRARGMMHVGHVGDSRCYRFRDGELIQLTHDHSLVNDALALKPDLTPEELARLPKNIITRALGMREDVKVDIRSEEVQEGDIFLLCSDGLSGMVNEEEMARVLGGIYAVDGADLREGCESLVSLANENGGTDNITALLIRIEARSDEPLDRYDADHDAEPTTDIEPEQPNARNRATARTRAAQPTPDGDPDAPEVTAQPVRMNTDEIEAVAAAEQGQFVVCPACDAQVVPDNVYCTECGAQLIEEE